MRKTKLLSATALATGAAFLMIGALGLSPIVAKADETITGSITTSKKTSESQNITLSGTQTIKSGKAITVDSDHTVTVTGTIDMSDSADGSTAISVDGAHTSSITVNGTIKVLDSFTATDEGSIVNGVFSTSTKDGIVDGPFSDALTRYAIRSTGAGPLVGNINIGSAAQISVEGKNSYGIRIENAITGNFSKLGSLTLTGANGKAISLESGVTGNVRIGGTTSILGENTTAVATKGAITGAFTIDGTVQGRGYSVLDSLTADQLKGLDPARNQAQSGVLIDIASSVGKGILFNATPVATANVTDADGDGVLDAEQGVATISQYGSAAALRIASSTEALTISPIVFGSTATADNKTTVPYALDIRGTIAANGVYSTITASTIQIGGLGQSVTLVNGARLKGNATSVTLNADAKTLWLKAGAVVPTFELSGILSSALTTTATNFTNTANALVIDAGASLPTLLLQAGSTLKASAVGANANAVAITDRSDSLSTINAFGNISATISGSDFNADGIADTVVNRPIAIDLSQNKVGTTINLTEITTDSITAPVILGDVLLGSGDDKITLTGTTLFGNLDIGAGQNSLILDKAGTTNSVFLGKINGSGNLMIDVIAGSLNLSSKSKINASSLHIGSTSSLLLVLDPTTPTTPVITSTGAVTFDNGGKIKLGLSSILFSPTKFTVLTGSSIGLGNVSLDLTGEVPYVYTASLSKDAGNTTLFADFRLKTAEEVGISTNEFGALNAVLNALATDQSGTNALLTKFTKDSFLSLYSQFLPDYSGETSLPLIKGSEALTRTLSTQTRLPDTGETTYWLQENSINLNRAHKETTGFKANGFNFAGGAERGLVANQAAGVYLAITSASPFDSYALGKESLSTNNISLGAYWRYQNEGLKSWLRVDGGYAKFESTRSILDASVNHQSTADWTGTSTSFGAGASYQIDAGIVQLTPTVLFDAFSLTEAAHKETGGGTGFDLSIGKRDSQWASTRAIVNISTSQTKWLFKPEAWLGYHSVLSAKLGDTVANFTNGTPFTLKSNIKQGGGPLVGMRVSVDNEYSYFGIEAEYEKQASYSNTSISIKARFTF